MTYSSLFALALSLSRLRRDADISGYDADEVVAWLDSSEPSIVLRVMLDVVKNARLAGLLPENRWVELVSHMRTHRFLLLASAVALTCKPEDIEMLQFLASSGGDCWKRAFELNKAAIVRDRTVPTMGLWEKISSVPKDCTRESFWELENPSPHQEGAVGKEGYLRFLDVNFPNPCLGEGFGKEEYAHTSDEGAAGEVHTSESINMGVACAPSFWEKVIAPMLAADWKGRQDFGRDGVIRTGWGTFLTESRERQFSEREKFVAKLLPPQHLRIIDCQQSLEKGVVVLIDRQPDIAYTAISHTFGQDVYTVYDCGCATTYMGDGKARANPAKVPCNGHHDLGEDKQSRVMNDMLNMCRILVEKGGVRYAWHDGICIAQYDEEDVKDAIMHMGWIYASAEDTVIFLHYAGQPMALIGTGCNSIPLVSRWQYRAWTFQEAVLSKHRRYCVLRGETSLGGCSDWQDFEFKVACWYAPGQSTIEIIDEADFFHSVILLHTQMEELRKKGALDTSARGLRVFAWFQCLQSLLDLLAGSLFFNVGMAAHALQGSSSRDSKHPGDHINSILALAGVQEFSVHKDEKVEESTLEFFERMGKKGLEFAVFTTNHNVPPTLEECSLHRLTWLPSLCGSLRVPLTHVQDGGANFYTSQIEFKVQKENGHIKLTGPLVCVLVRFYWKKSQSQNEEREAAESSRVAALVAKDISELAELHSSDDGLGIFLCKDPVRTYAWVGSELRTGGALLGQALFPYVVPGHWPVRDEKTVMEFSNILEGNTRKLVPVMSYEEGSDEVGVCYEEESDELSTAEQMQWEREGWLPGHEVSLLTTAKRMDWREAWVSSFLSRKIVPDPTWAEAMQKFFFLSAKRVDALTRCGKHNFSGLMTHLREFFEFPTVDTFVQPEPSLQRHEVGTFCASLVFPAELLSCDSADFRIHGFQTLVLNGDCVESPVTKIGCFEGSVALHKLLTNNRTNFRYLTELEIC